MNAQQTATISIIVKNHRFQPAEVSAPANVPIVLRVKNLDATPMEFESVSVRVERLSENSPNWNSSVVAAGAPGGPAGAQSNKAVQAPP